MINKNYYKIKGLRGIMRGFYDTNSAFRYSTAILIGVNTSLIVVWVVSERETSSKKLKYDFFQMGFIMVQLYAALYGAALMAVDKQKQDLRSLGFSGLLTVLGIELPPLPPDSMSDDITKKLEFVLEEATFWVELLHFTTTSNIPPVRLVYRHRQRRRPNRCYYDGDFVVVYLSALQASSTLHVPRAVQGCTELAQGQSAFVGFGMMFSKEFLTKANHLRRMEFVTLATSWPMRLIR